MQDTKPAAAPHPPPFDQSGRASSAPRPVTVNGESLQTSAETLLELLADLGYGINRVATAVNGEFVPERLRADRRLTVGDAVEIVSPRQGG